MHCTLPLCDQHTAWGRCPYCEYDVLRSRSDAEFRKKSWDAVLGQCSQTRKVPVFWTPPRMRKRNDLRWNANSESSFTTDKPHDYLLGWAATFLASPYARFISGHTLVVDGANWQRRSLTNPPVQTIRDQMGRGDFQP